MIDDSDADDFFLLSLFTDGPVGWIALIIAIILAVVAANNQTDCSKKQCPNQQQPKLMEHACLCVTEAK